MSYVFTIESDGNSANSAEYNTLAECNSALNSRRQSAIANGETFTFGGCTGSPADTSSNPSSNNTIGATNNSSGGTPYTYLEPLSSTSSSVEISEAGFSTYLQLVMTVGIAVLVIIGVFYLIYGGIMYMTTDVINNKNRGRSMISNAVVGVVFALSIWLILNAINPDMLNIRLGGFGNSVSSGNSTGGLSTVGSSTGVGTGTSSVPIINSPCTQGFVSVGGIVVCKTIEQNLHDLLSAAQAAGITLTGTGQREVSRQIELRKQNCGTSNYAIYEMPSGQCSPPTAIPGTSMHEKGLAIDFKYQGQTICYSANPNGRCSGNIAYDWLKANASKYGFSARTSEPWHWSTTGF